MRAPPLEPQTEKGSLPITYSRPLLLPPSVIHQSIGVIPVLPPHLLQPKSEQFARPLNSQFANQREIVSSPKTSKPYRTPYKVCFQEGKLLRWAKIINDSHTLCQQLLMSTHVAKTDYLVLLSPQYPVPAIRKSLRPRAKSLWRGMEGGA